MSKFFNKTAIYSFATVDNAVIIFHEAMTKGRKNKWV